MIEDVLTIIFAIILSALGMGWVNKRNKDKFRGK